jgi:hypothetical protein
MGRYDVLLQQEQKKETHARPAAQEPSPAPRHEPTASPPEDASPPPRRTSGASLPHPKSEAPRSGKRGFVRRSFDFYEDQVSYLTKVSLHERLAGKEGSMNAMVREAIDDYIKKRTNGK